MTRHRVRAVAIAPNVVSTRRSLCRTRLRRCGGFVLAPQLRPNANWQDSPTPAGGDSTPTTDDPTADGSASPSTAEIRAASSRSLAVTGRLARIPAIVKRGGYRAKVAAMAAGTLTIEWQHSPAAARRLVVAYGQKKFDAAGNAQVLIRLTRQGRRLLKQSRSLKLVAVATFVPLDGDRVTVRRKITVKR